MSSASNTAMKLQDTININNNVSAFMPIEEVNRFSFRLNDTPP